MEEDKKSFFIDLHMGQSPPHPGMYMVSVGKKGIGSVYLIHEVKKINTKKNYRFRYGLKVTMAMEMKPFVVHDENTNQIWVKGEAAQPVHWYKRIKKPVDITKGWDEIPKEVMNSHYGK